MDSLMDGCKFMFFYKEINDTEGNKKITKFKSKNRIVILQIYL